MASDVKSATESGSSSSNPPSTPPKIVPDSSPVPSQPPPSTKDSSLIPSQPPWSTKDEQLQMGTGYAPPPYPYYAGGYPMVYGGPSYPGQPSYFPPPPPLYPTYDEPPSKKKARRLCLCRLVCIFIALTIFFSILASFREFVYKPKSPSVSLTSATLAAFTFANSSTIMSFDLNVTFLLKNPNANIGIAYDLIQIEVFYRSKSIGKSVPLDFYQGGRSDKLLADKVIDRRGPTFTSTIKGINEDLVNGGVVEFSVDLQALITFSRMIGLTKKLEANCPGVKIRFANGTAAGEGTLEGPWIICDVRP